MKHEYKRLLSLLLALVMVLSLFPATAFAEEGEETEEALAEEIAEAPAQEAESAGEPGDKPEALPPEEPVFLPEDAEDYPLVEEGVPFEAEVDGNMAYFRFIPEKTAEYAFYSYAGSDTYGYVFDADMNQLTSDDDGGEGNNFRIRMRMEEGLTYVLGMRFYYNISGTIPAVIEKCFYALPAGLDSNEELTVEAELGGNVLLEVEAGGPAPISYQWYDADWYSIEGANGPTLEVGPITQKTSYFCYVSDEQGSNDYVYFSVSIRSGLTAEAKQSEVTVIAGQTAQLEVLASIEVGEIHYQWQAPGYNDIAGANGSTLTLGAEAQSGSYRCVVWDDYDNVIPVNFQVTVDNGFSAEPVQASFTVAPLESVTFEVSASCNLGELHYQWYNNHYNSIEGATGASYTVDSVESSGWYYCEVRDDYDGYAQISFRVNVDNQFSAAPVGDTRISAAPEAELTLAVEASCAVGELHYQWYESWNSIEGETGAALTVQVLESYTEYRCYVSDDYGNGYWAYFYITRDNQFRAEAVEEVVLAAPGADAVLAVEASCLSGEIHYQWFKDGGEPLEGETGATLTVPAVTGPAEYYCIVSDDYGSGVQINFSVYVDSGLTAEAVRPSQAVRYGESAALEVAASVTAGEVHYQWFDSQGDPIEGQTEASLLLTEVTEDEFPFCLVSDDYGNEIHVPFEIQVDSGLFACAQGNTNISAYYGDEVTMKVLASSEAGGITYQWYDQNGTAIEGETGAALTVTAMRGGDYYRCAVSDVSGAEQIVGFDVYASSGLEAWVRGNLHHSNSVTVPYRPGEELTLAVEATVAVGELHYLWRDYEGHIFEGETGPELTLTEVTSSRYYCVVSDDYNSTYWVYFYMELDTGLTAEPVGPTSLTVDEGESVTLQVRASSAQGYALSYAWSKDGEVLEGEESDTLVIASVEAAAYYLCTVTDTEGHSASVGFNVRPKGSGEYPALELDVPAVATISTGGEMAYFSFTPETSGIYSFYSSVKDGNRCDTYGHLFDENMNQITSNDDGGGNAQFLMNVRLEAGRTYILGARMYSGDTTGSFYVTVTDKIFYAYPETQPNSSTADLYVQPHGSVELKVVAGSPAGIESYIWRDYNTGELLSKVTGDTLLLEDVTNAQSYRCEVLDTRGQYKYVYFYIYVENGFSAWIKGLPEEAYSTAVSVPYGGDALMEVEATVNQGEIHYAWSYRDSGRLIAGAEGASATVHDVKLSRTCVCKVSDDFGNSRELEFRIEVESGLRAWAAGYPEETSYVRVGVAPNEDAVLEVVAETDLETELRYEWRDWSYGRTLNETGSSLRLTKVRSAGEYACAVYDSFGNRCQVQFYVYVDNAFTAYPKGAYSGNNGVNITVPYGGSTELQVIASCREGEISYRWYRNWEELTEYGDTLTVTNITAATNYQCQVSDEYGNNRTVYFYIGIENGLRIEPDGDYEYDSWYGDWLVTAAPHGEATMAALATANTGDVSYRWWAQGDSSEILSTERSLTLRNVTTGGRYYCQAADIYGNTASLCFRVQIENSFTAYPEGMPDWTPNNGPVQLTVQPHGGATLKVVASCREGALDYYWYADSSSSKTLSETDTLALTDITQANIFYCEVSDQYGNSRTVSFRIAIENGFDAWAKDWNWSRTDRRFTVGLHEDALMEVEATATSGGIHYHWYDNQSGQLLAEGTPSYTLHDVTAYTQITCHVTDDFGNSRNVWFYVGVENGLTAWSVNTGYEYEELEVPFGGSATLAIEASADDMEGLSYSWYVWRSGYGQIELGGDEPTLTVSGIEQSTTVYGVAHDKYGNTAEVQFNICIANNFHAYVEGTTQTWTRVLVAYNGSATLKATVTADDMSGMSYRWYFEKQTADGWSWEELPGSGLSRTVKNITGRCHVYFEATDKYGTTRTVSFELGVQNHLKAVDAETGTTNRTITCAAGASVTMRVKATADNSSGMKYQWYRLSGENWTVIEGATRASLSLEAVNETTQVYCGVTDKFGTTATVQYYIRPTNLISAYIRGTEKTSEHRTVTNGSTTLEVTVSAYHPEKLAKRWYEVTRDEDGSEVWTLLEGETGAALRLSGLSGKHFYVFAVNDEFENYLEVHFSVEAGSSTPVKRIYGSNRFDTSIRAAEEYKRILGVDLFDAVVVAYGHNFADALGGSYLAIEKQAPILLIDPAHVDSVRAYIKQNLKPGGTVYMLGGNAVVPDSLRSGLESFLVVRLAGMDRYDTNLQILVEAGVEDGSPILVCSGNGFADSLSASASGYPILLVSNSLRESQKLYLSSLGGTHEFIMIGGEGAVSKTVMEQCSNYGRTFRLGGKNRYETSAIVAYNLVQPHGTAVLSYGQNFPDGLCGAPLAAALGAPLLLVADGKEGFAAEYAAWALVGETITLGGPALIADQTVRNIA